MNHTDFINRFWRLDEECRFSAVETRLFLMLIDLFARVGVERSVTWTNNLATGLLGVSLNAFRKACASLEQRGLIVVESAIVKRRRYTTISLAGAEAAPAVDAGMEASSVSGQQEVEYDAVEPENTPVRESEHSVVEEIVVADAASVAPASASDTCPVTEPVKRKAAKVRTVKASARLRSAARGDKRRHGQRTIPLSVLLHKSKG